MATCTTNEVISKDPKKHCIITLKMMKRWWVCTGAACQHQWELWIWGNLLILAVQHGVSGRRRSWTVWADICATTATVSFASSPSLRDTKFVIFNGSSSPERDLPWARAEGCPCSPPPSSSGISILPASHLENQTTLQPSPECLPTLRHIHRSRLLSVPQALKPFL